MSVLDATPKTPPAPVRLAMMLAYVYSLYLGAQCLVLPHAPAAAIETAADAAQRSVLVLAGVYALDAFLAACPLHWCCMRSIPPKNVLQHHLPYVVAMLPSCWLALKHAAGFHVCLVQAPSAIVYMAAGCLTSGNEALWVASSFFPKQWLDAKAYRVGQKVFALTALSQFLLLGGYGALRTLVDLAPLVAANGEHTFVRACMISPCAAFVVVVPFVQIPLLKGAFSRLKDAINGQDRTLGRSASCDHLHPPPAYRGPTGPPTPTQKAR